jgi:colicin import membrane protein
VSTTEIALAEKAKALSLPTKTAEEMIAEYAPFAVAIQEKITEVSQIQTLTPVIARRVRLETVKIRTGCDKKRKELKADILVRGKAIDGLCSLVEMSATSLENQMEDIEKEAERKEAARINALAEDRARKLRQYCDMSFCALGPMTDQAFESLLEGQRLIFEQREAARIAAEQAELARLAKAKADAEEAEKKRQEELAAAKEAARIAHEKAKAEAVARAKAEAEAAEQARIAREQAAEEKRKADAVLAAERASRAKAEAEAAAKAKADAEEMKRQRDELFAKAKSEADRVAAEKRKADEAIAAERRRVAELERAAMEKAKAEAAAKAKAEAEAAEAKRKAAAAPDAEKIRQFADMISSNIPTLSPVSKDQQQKIHDQVAKMTAWLHTMARNMA